MKLGIYGGTFNPPHNGHLMAASRVHKEIGLDKLLFIPANSPPHKALPPGSATTRQRVEMVRLAVQELPFADLSTIEIERGGRSYTVDTVRQLRNRWKEPELFLVVGTDMLLSLTSWHMPRVLLSMCTLAAVARAEQERPVLERQARWLEQEWGARVRLIQGPAFELSSTQIRAAVNGQGLCGLVPERVAAYIREHGLYQ